MQVQIIYGYTGLAYDYASDLSYARARYFDSGVGRFINEDTYQGELNNPLSLNLYTYVYNNPLKYIDPSGYAPCYSESQCKQLDEKLGLSKSTSYKRVDEMSYGELMDILMDPTASANDQGQVMAAYIFTHYVLGATAIKEIKALTSGIKATSGTKATSGIKGAGSVTKACNCFTAGTKVVTDEGEKNIEDIEVGDKVLSKNEETGEIAYKEVTHLYRNDKDIIYELTVGDQVIETTDNHPFWVEGKGWVLAADLQVGDKLQQSNGNTLTIDNINIVKHDEKVKVYNFTVADFHTYFVSDLGIWVHNIGPCDVLPSQGKVSVVDGAPSVDAGKQGKHVPGHSNNVSTKSQWADGQNGVKLTQEAWLNGTVV